MTPTQIKKLCKKYKDKITCNGNAPCKSKQCNVNKLTSEFVNREKHIMWLLDQAEKCVSSKRPNNKSVEQAKQILLFVQGAMWADTWISILDIEDDIK